MRWAPQELIAAAAAADEGAVERLIIAVWPACFRLAASLIGDRALAQDAAQEACVILHRKISTLRSAAAFDMWLYRIVAREASRARKRSESVMSPLYEESAVFDCSTGIDVWRALAELPQALRETTVLFYFDDLKSEEIARILRVPHATVRTRLARAREHLRGLLGDYDIEPHSAKGVAQHAC